jgi:hypothetical protein
MNISRRLIIMICPTSEVLGIAGSQILQSDLSFKELENINMQIAL